MDTLDPESNGGNVKYCDMQAPGKFEGQRAFQLLPGHPNVRNILVILNIDP